MCDDMQKVNKPVKSIEELCELYDKLLAEYERRIKILKKLQKKDNK